MQRTGHPVAEVARFTLGVVGFVITDVADPGGSFHVVATAHVHTLQIKFSVIKTLSIMPSVEDKGKRLRSKKGIVVDD